MQWEFPGRLGPPPGRYVVRRFAGDEVREVIVVSDVDAPRRRGRREPAGIVPVTRVTVIDASPLEDDHAAAWLRGPTCGTRRRSRAWWPPTASPRETLPGDADPTRALAVRVGYGSGDQVAEGEWTDVRELEVPERPEPRRRSKHRPMERLAALLAGRDAVLACEELTLRARADLDLGREREAALQLEAALGAALAELAGWVSHGDLTSRLEELHGYAAGRRGRCRRLARGGWRRRTSSRSASRSRGWRRRCERARSMRRRRTSRRDVGAPRLHGSATRR